MVKSVNFKHTVRTTILETCIGTPKKLTRTNIVMMRQLMCLETPTIFGLGGGIIFLSS